MSKSYKNSYKVPQQEFSSLTVRNTGYQKCSPSYQWGPGIRDHYLLHHVISGKGYYKVKNQIYTLSAGDSFLIYPFEEVSYYADESDPWEYAWVGFVGKDAEMILKGAGFHLENLIRHQDIKQPLMRIFEARGSELYNAVEMTGRLYTMLSLLLEQQNQKEHKKETSYDIYIRKGMEYIHSYYSYPITVEDIANYVGVSRSHLFRAFEKGNLGSPKQYLTQFRIDQACILLQHSELSIHAISRSVGFEDSLHFSKVFKKSKGKAPSKYEI